MAISYRLQLQILSAIRDADSSDELITLLEALSNGEVLSLNGETGTVTLTEGSNITITPDGMGNIEIAASGGGGGANTSLSNLVAPTAINEDLIFDTGNPTTIKTVDNSTATKSMTITSGDTTGTTVNTGNVIVTSGLGPNHTGNLPHTGNVIVQSGDSERRTGDVTITSGISNTRNSGNLNLNTGSVNSGSGSSGSVLINTGEVDAGNSGEIRFRPGDSFSGTKGNVVVEGTELTIFADTTRIYGPNLNDSIGLVGQNGGSVTFSLPFADGSSGDVLTTDGAGILSFAPAGGTTIPKVAAKMGGSQNIPDNAATPIIFDVEITDTDAQYNPVTGIVTCTRDGFVSVDACVRLQGGGTGSGRYLSINHSGIYYTVGVNNVTETDATYNVKHGCIAVTAGSTISIEAFQDSGGAITAFWQIYQPDDTGWFNVVYLP